MQQVETGGLAAAPEGAGTDPVETSRGGDDRAQADLAELQAELIHVSRVNAMNAMSTTLAHELNQPLSAIANYVAGSLRLIGPGSSEDPRLERALLGIREASERAADIIRNLHELTKRREPVRATFELEPAIDECIRLVSSAIAPGVCIAKDIPAGLEMTANRVQIQQVVINLLRNAGEAALAARRSSIAISAIEASNELVIGVTDNGTGVAPDQIDAMFRWSNSTKEGGMGLGLSICRTIVEMHGGRIWLERTDDTGAEFRFAIPKAGATGAR